MSSSGSHRKTASSLIKYFFGILFTALLIMALEMYLRSRHSEDFRTKPEQTPSSELILSAPVFEQYAEETGVVMRSNWNPDVEFSVVKSSAVFRIFIVGGSVSENMDESRLSFWMKRVMPDKRIETFNCGKGGFDSNEVLRIFDEIIDYDPDLLIVMSGNNEYLFMSRNFSRFRYYPVIRELYGFINSLYVYRLLKGVLAGHVKHDRSVISSPIDERIIRTKLYSHNLDHIARMCGKREIPLIFCTFPVNFIYPPADTGGEIWSIFKTPSGLRGKIELETGRYEDALCELEDYLQSDTNNSQAHFYIAKAYIGLGMSKKAREHFIKAVDLDIPGYRCNSLRNKVIRRITERSGAELADIEKGFLIVQPDGLFDFKFFSDFCHFDQPLYSIVFQMIGNAYCRRYVTDRTVVLDLTSDDTAEMISKVEKNRTQDYYTSALSFYIFVELFHHFNGYAEPDTIGWIYDQSPELIIDTDKNKDLIISFLERSPATSIYLDDIEKGWSRLDFAIGEMFRVKGLYDEALKMYAKCDFADVDMKKSLLLFRGITYSLSWEKEKAVSDFKELAGIDPDFEWLSVNGYEMFSELGSDE